MGGPHRPSRACNRNSRSWIVRSRRCNGRTPAAPLVAAATAPINSDAPRGSRTGRKQQVGQRTPDDEPLVNAEQLLRLVRDRHDGKVVADDKEHVRRCRRDLGDGLEQQPKPTPRARALEALRLLACRTAAAAVRAEPDVRRRFQACHREQLPRRFSRLPHATPDRSCQVKKRPQSPKVGLERCRTRINLGKSGQIADSHHLVRFVTR